MSNPDGGGTADGPAGPLIELRGITKRFPGVLANDKIDLEIESGEIHAILGENGAGKTTLMKILFGMLQPDEGEIRVQGRQVVLDSPLDAIEMGIGMVHQDRKLINAHSALENIVLGHPSAQGVLDLAKAEREVQELIEAYGLKVDLHAKVWQLGEGEKQIVEILKALYRGANVLILDEPTSALSPLETEKFLESIRSMAGGDLALVPFITHKLPIVLRISDRVTVLRDGRVVARTDTAGISERELAEKMVGEDVLVPVDKPRVPRGEVVLKVEDLRARNDKGVTAFEGMSFTIRQGEIFSVAGVAGNGQNELAEVLAGLRPATGGKVFFEGQDITKSSVLDRWRQGVAYVPPERKSVASIGEFSLVENVALNYYFEEEFQQGGLLDQAKLRDFTEELVEEYGVVTPSVDVKAGKLSGGNLQRLILARVLARKPRLLIASLPTQGLDIAAASFVRSKLLQARSDNAAILLISEDLDETLTLSDRVAPIYEGHLMAILPEQEAKRETVGAMMAGVRPAGAKVNADR